MVEIKKHILSEIDEFASFCNQHRRLYLYGAGKIGRKYLSVLRYMGKLPEGFIISEGCCGEVEGVKVFLATEIGECWDESIGVIATFKGANEEDLRLCLGERADIFLPNDDLCSILEWEYVLFPFLKKRGCTKAPLKNKSEWRSILIIRLDVLGDSIMSTAFIREIRKNCPDSHITLVINPKNELLFRDCPYITELCIYDFVKQSEDNILSYDYLKYMWDEEIKYVDSNLIRQYDIVFQLCPVLSGRNAMEALMLGCACKADCQVGRVYSWKKSEDRVTYINDKISQLFSFVSYDEMPKHEVECMLDMLRRCGGVVKDESLELWCHMSNDHFLELVSQYNIDTAKKWIAIGVVGRLPSQCWPADRFSQFFLELRKKHDVGFIMFGGNEAVEVAEKIQKTILDQESIIIDLTGKTTLIQAIEAMRHCIAYVGANTGLMHMAAAVGLPVVEISFYVRDEEGRENSPMGPWWTKSIVLQKSGMDGCTEICSKPYSHCITQITVQEVVEATEKILFDKK